MRTACIALTGSIAAGCFVHAQPVDVGPIVDGVSAVSSGGAPGPLAVSDEWSGIAANDSAGSYPGLAVAVRDFGSGRVAAAAHRAFVVRTDLLDNARLSRQLMLWLAGDGRRVRQFIGGGASGGQYFADPKLGLAAEGFDFGTTAVLTAESISDTDVLIISLLREPLDDAEIDLLVGWVAAGGALYLDDLHWVWDSYFDLGAGEGLPLNSVGRRFGVSWLRGYLTHPTDSLEGSPVHRAVGRAADPVTQAEALEILAGIDGSRTRVELRDLLDFGSPYGLAIAEAVHALAIDIEAELGQGASSALELERLISTAPLFDPAGRLGPFWPTAAWVRAQAWLGLIERCRQTGECASVLVANSISDRRQQWLAEHDVFVLDDFGLDEDQQQAVESVLDAIPGDLPRPKFITVREYLGVPDLAIDRMHGVRSVNVFGVDVDAASQNQFPADAPAISVPVFSIVVAHELMHVIDAFGVTPNSAIDAHRDRVLAQAGEEPMQYLRSMFEPGFFTRAPQEFLASIANQWFADSEATIDLGVARAGAGWLGPINQAALMARIFRSGDQVVMMRMDALGQIDVELAGALFRPDGKITSLRCGGRVYSFSYGTDGLIDLVESSCPADTNNDGLVTPADYNAWILAYNNRAPECDQNGDGLCTPADFNAWILNFNAGCS